MIDQTICSFWPHTNHFHLASASFLVSQAFFSVLNNLIQLQINHLIQRQNLPTKNLRTQNSFLCLYSSPSLVNRTKAKMRNHSDQHDFNMNRQNTIASLSPPLNVCLWCLTLCDLWTRATSTLSFRIVLIRIRNVCFHNAFCGNAMMRANFPFPAVCASHCHQ